MSQEHDFLRLVLNPARLCLEQQHLICVRSWFQNQHQDFLVRLSLPEQEIKPDDQDLTFVMACAG
jgi:hypothetical protein